MLKKKAKHISRTIFNKQIKSGINKKTDKQWILSQIKVMSMNQNQSGECETKQWAEKC